MSRNGRRNRRRFLALLTTAVGALSGCSESDERSGERTRVQEVTATGYDDSRTRQPTIEGERKKWHRTSLTYSGPSTSEGDSKNPFLDYRLTVTFTSPSGTTYEVPGHYAADGNAADSSASSGDKWRAYFSPDETGTWEYSTSFVTGSNVAVSGTSTSSEWDSGSFDVDDTDESGSDFRAKGRLTYTGEPYLQHQETNEYFIKVGAGSPENFLGYDEFDNAGDTHDYSPHEPDWNPKDPTWQNGKGKGIIGAVNYLASKGINAHYILTYNTDDGDGQDVWPWTGTSTYRRFDVSKLDQWEIVFHHMQTKGVLIHLLHQETENDTEIGGNGGLNTERKLYYRELISRFGHHPGLVWNLGEETNLSVSQLKNIASYIHSLDPYDHPVTVHNYPSDSEQERIFGGLLGYADFDGPSIQTSGNDLTTANEDVRKWRRASASNGRKWVCSVDESGHHKCGIPPDGVTCDNGDTQDDARKRSLWGALMGGGAGHSSYFGYENDHDDLTLEDYRSRDLWWDYNRYAKKFFKENIADLPAMQPDNNALGGENGYVLRDSGTTHVAYLSNGTNNATLDLPSGTYTLDWYDPQTGLFEGETRLLNGCSDTDLGTVPDAIDDDAVALITRPTE